MTIAIDRAFNDGAWTYTDPEEHQFVVTATLMHYPIEAIDNFIELGERPDGECAGLLKPSDAERAELLGLRSSALEAYKVGAYELEDAYLIALHYGCRFYGLRMGARPAILGARRRKEVNGEISKKPRHRTAPNGEKWTWGKLCAELAGMKDEIGGHLQPKELWPELFAQLDGLGLKPQEFGPDTNWDAKRIEYGGVIETGARKGKRKHMTYKHFKDRLREARKIFPV